MSSTRYSILLFALIAFGCDAGMLPQQREVVYFTSLETDIAKPIPIPDPEPDIPKAQRDIYDPIMEGFLKNHEQLVARADIKTQLERLETVFVGAGRYLELYAIYQEDFKERGMDSHVVERLAWGHVRLGQQKAARDLIDKLIAKNPTDPNAHFLSGAYYLQWEPTSDESLKGMTESWGRVLELDPNFRGYEGISANDLRVQVERAMAILKQRKPAEAAAPAALDVAKQVVTAAPDAALAAVAPQPEVPDTETPDTPDGAVEPEIDDTPEVVNTPTPAAPTIEEQYRLAVAKGEILLAEGNPMQAEESFVAAKKFKANGVEAELGQLKIGWTIPNQRNTVSARIKLMAKREDLTARQTYEIGLFAYSRMTDTALASELWARTKKLDPEMAKQLGIENLLK